MDWINNFYSTTGKWWGPAEAEITQKDQQRVALLQAICPDSKTVLELGSGYGSTAAITADSGYSVVANELSERINFSKKFEKQDLKGSLKFIKGDFYTTDLGNNFDVVAYWNGFGIGTDSDQRRLLKRISSDWLNEDGIALIDIGNPFVRASWAGEKEHKDANPKLGYTHTIDEITDYDPVHNRFTDTWWESDKPDAKLTQTLRNYTPADLTLLLEGTGMKLDSIYVDGQKLDMNKEHVGDKRLLRDEQEYLAVLVRE